MKGQESSSKRSYEFLKRAFDVFGALAALVALAPLMLAVAALLSWDLGSPTIFRQARLGRYGREFRIWKFRTMRDERAPNSAPLADGDRVTRFGNFLRRTSIDELPELINVLRGEMSLVGPRPLLPQYLDRYSERQARRHDVLPGITGWAQVNGRNGIGWNERFEMDVWYADHRTVVLDGRILLRTVWKVLRREGILAPGDITMPEFMGPEGPDRWPGPITSAKTPE